MYKESERFFCLWGLLFFLYKQLCVTVSEEKEQQTGEHN